MAFSDFLKKLRPGRRRIEPARDTRPYPAWNIYGQVQNRRFPAARPTPRRIRHFGHTPIARRALNSIKNRIAMLDWEVVPIEGVSENSEIKRQIAIVHDCLQYPNDDDSFRLLAEQVIEDILHGAGAIEIGVSGDPQRPLWLWPTDGLTIQVFPGWTGQSLEARYIQSIGYLSTSSGSQQGILLRNDELIYIRPNPSTATPFGFGPLEIAFDDISRLLGVADYAGKVASNRAPSFGIDLGPYASAEEAATFRSYWQHEVEGEGKVPIWGMGGGEVAPGSIAKGGAQVVRFFPEGDTALFLKYQELQTRVIACAFDISPMNLNIERDVNRNTAETGEDMTWDTAIVPYATLLQSHLNREAIQGALGFRQIKFQFKGLRREDQDKQSQIHQRYFMMNALTPNEIREEIGKPPMVHQFADLTYADIEIAKNAARSVGAMEDTALPVSAAPKDVRTQPAAPAKPAASANQKPRSERK